MSTKIRPTHVVCGLAGVGVGISAGGLVGVEIDLSRAEAISTLITICGVSLVTLVMTYFERRFKGHVDRVNAERAAERQADREEGYIQGYLARASEVTATRG